MATPFSSTLYTSQKPDRANTSRLPNPLQSSGQVEFATIPYTLVTGDLPATGGILYLCELPPGAIPLPHLSSIVCSQDPGTGTTTVDIGTAENPDGWCDGADISTGGQVWCNTPAVPAWQVATEIAADTGATNATVYATFAGVSGSLTAGTIIYFNLAWKRQA